MKLAAMLLLAGLSPALYAQTPATPGLPSADQAMAALEATPEVAGARAGLGWGAAEGALLRRGDYEFQVNTTLNQRRVADAAQRYNEWAVGLERSLRLPGKARLDAALGQQTMAVARESYGDALHEAGRMLLTRWFTWLRARQQLARLDEQSAALAQIRAAVAKRVRAGDASALELVQADAALATVAAGTARARSDEALRRTELAQHYPGLSLAPAPSLPAPAAVEGDMSAWRERMFTHNHELARARAESDRARLALKRSEADRVPDPTVGVHYGSERGGEERLVGVSVSVPLPGAQRGYRVDRALAENRMASERERAVQVRLETQVRVNFENAQGSYASWQAARQAADSLHTQALKLARAQALGEAGIAEVLLARRQYLEVALSADQARGDAWEARYRLMLDAHELWPFHVEEEGTLIDGK